jgi:hypothetical protein
MTWKSEFSVGYLILQLSDRSDYSSSRGFTVLGYSGSFSAVYTTFSTIVYNVAFRTIDRTGWAFDGSRLKSAPS